LVPKKLDICRDRLPGDPEDDMLRKIRRRSAEPLAGSLGVPATAKTGHISRSDDEIAPVLASGADGVS
jgi:hypothetical protein